MAKVQQVRAARGTRDILPEEWKLRSHVIDIARRAFSRYGFGRISTPTFEHTELFQRGVGESTDVVRKEMYTFSDRSDRSLTLRPEGTAPVVRAFLEHGMQRLPLPVKLWYEAPMFRYEKPQEGRYREHVQVGAEVIGSPFPEVDAELITLLGSMIVDLGVTGVTLRLGSIGDNRCRGAYREKLVDFLSERNNSLCDDCLERTKVNPLRTFDCKVDSCRKVMRDAPTQMDNLCSDCDDHFSQLKAMLDASGVSYFEDPTLVRGFDYYTRTTFEFSCSHLGAQDAIGGGGRFDGLVEHLGGTPTPAVGFGCGVERLMLAVQASPAAVDETESPEIFVCSDSASAAGAAFAVANALRSNADAGIVELDLARRSRKGALKHASRIKAGFALIVDEAGNLDLHNMRGREEVRIQANADAVVSAIKKMKEGAVK